MKQKSSPWILKASQLPPTQHLRMGELHLRIAVTQAQPLNRDRKAAPFIKQTTDLLH